jgi:glutaredoxin
MSKRYLENNAVSYEMVDIETDAEGLDYIRSLNYSAVPVIVVSQDGHKVDDWHGYDPDKLNTLLEK